jgi:hypothetical protein
MHVCHEIKQIVLEKDLETMTDLLQQNNSFA